MSGFRVDLAELQRVVDAAGATQRELDAALDRVAARVARLDATWTGAAADAHDEAHARWAAAYDEMRGALADLRTAAGVAHDRYEAAVASNLAAWGAVR